jgi:LytS/YehU family sensor histidine kinase
MQNYISLEKLRLSDKVKIQFNIEGDIDNARITPLILITFLENAFKHGVTNTAKESWIAINLNCAGNKLSFSVANSKPPTPRTDEKSGIGLQNVKRRLELSYPGKYHLSMTDMPAEYRVQLDLSFA